MFVRFFDEAGTGGTANQPAEKPADQGKQVSPEKKPDPASVGQPGKPAEKQPEGGGGEDLAKLKKEHEALKEYHARYQSETTAKLQKLAEIEKTEEVAKTAKLQDDEIAGFDARIENTRNEIARYKEERVDSTALENSLVLLEREKKQIIRERIGEAARERFSGFADAHPDFNDYAALNKVIAEAKRDGDFIGPETAYKIWKRERDLAEAKGSKAITEENAELGNRARGQDGKPLPTPEKETAGDKARKGIWGY